MKQTKVKPATFSNSAIADLTSISIINDVLDKSLVFPELRSGDKTPGTDGVIWLLDENVPIGRVEVQVKTITGSYNKPSKSLKLSLLAFIKESQLPFLIILVDPVKRFCYWKCMDSSEADQLINTALDKGNKSITIHFDSEQCFPQYAPYECWKQIVVDHKNLLQKAKETQDQLLLTNDILNNIKGESDVSSRDPNFIHINLFLETLNHLFNYEFKVVKQLFIGEFWRFGVSVFGEFSQQRAAYSLFSIEADENVKSIVSYPNIERIQDIFNVTFDFESFGGKNPFFDNPKKLAFTTIQKYMNRLLDEKRLWPKDNLLQNEFLFSIRDDFKQLGFEEVLELDLESFKIEIERIIGLSPEHDMKMWKEFPYIERNLFRALDYIQGLRLEGNKTITRLTPSKKSLSLIKTSAFEKGQYPAETLSVLKSYFECIEVAYNHTLAEMLPMLIEELKIKRDHNFQVGLLSEPIQSQIPILTFIDIKIPSKNDFELVIEENWYNTKINIDDFEVRYRDSTYKMSRFRNESIIKLLGSDKMPIRAGVYALLKNNIKTYFELNH